MRDEQQPTYSELLDVTVKVPAHEVGAFYRMFGDWLEGRRRNHDPKPNPTPAVPLTDWGIDPEADRACAAAITAKLSRNGKALIEHLLAVGEAVTSNDLAAALGFPAEKGASMVAGTLAWPGRHAAEAGRPLPVAFSDEESPTRYWMQRGADAAFAAALGTDVGAGR